MLEAVMPVEQLKEYLESKAAEMVDSPSHYIAGPYECEMVEKAIDEKMLAGSELIFTGYEARLYFAAFEYLWRAPFKGGLQDLRKCRRDLDRLIESLEEA